jgi:hypothetical protein
LVIAFVSLTAIACVTTAAPKRATVISAEQQKPPADVVSGWGGFALSASTTSLWLTAPAGGPSGRPQPLFLIYYVGAPGWHDAEWGFDGEFSKLPAFVRLRSARFDLAAEYQGGGRAIVQGTPVDLSSANVFLVAPIDSDWSVKPLGKVVFDVPPNGIPAVHVISTHLEIREAVVEKARLSDPTD